MTTTTLLGLRHSQRPIQPHLATNYIKPPQTWITITAVPPVAIRAFLRTLCVLRATLCSLNGTEIEMNDDNPNFHISCDLSKYELVPTKEELAEAIAKYSDIKIIYEGDLYDDE